MRKVKCQVTGICGTSDTFYKAPNGKYYETEDIYETYKLDKEYYEKIFFLINREILKCSNYNSANAFIGKLIKESNLTPKEIYESIYDNRDYLIAHIVNGSYANNTAKIVSIFTIATKRMNYITYAGSYEIRNTDTNEVYIGESINLFERFTQHISDLYNNNHHCKALQELFNQSKDISKFKITPLFMFKVISNDKKIIKEETLYLESAFYLIAKYHHENILNTLNPYLALKHGTVELKNYDIDCKHILRLLCEDKYDVLPNDIKKLIRENLQEIVGTVSKTDNLDVSEQINQTKSANAKSLTDSVQPIQKNEKILGEGLFRISTILNECKEKNIIPQNSNYNKIRRILEEHNLIVIDNSGYTVATKYALDHQLYIVSDTKIRNGKDVFNYYITTKGKAIIVNILKNYSDKDDLSVAS